MKTLVALIFSMILVGAFPFATQAAIDAGPESDELRVALVIGNSDYPASPLASPVADARGMTSQLRRLGFTSSAWKTPAPPICRWRCASSAIP